ncbi:FecR family protein [Pseudomonas putida]
MPRHDPRISEQAADWLLRLGECPGDAQLRARFHTWRDSDPRHAAAAERLAHFVSQVHSLRPVKAPAIAALGSPRTQRARLAVALLLISAATFLALPTAPALCWLAADVHTPAGQWRSQTLADHSQISLAGNSAVDIEFDGPVRRIVLRQGQILVQVAKDPQRPFVVQTPQGTVRALGTRFMVTREGQSTVVDMLESRVLATAGRTGQSAEVSAGSEVRITADSVTPAQTIQPARVEQAWQRHQLVVHDQPLGDVLQALAAQHGGWLRFDRQALDSLRISAVLPLDDSERALQLIQESLPVTVSHYSPWITTVTPKAP